MCSAAAIKLKVAGGKRGIFIAAAAVVYSVAMFVGAGWEATAWGIAFALAGLPIRALSRWLNRDNRATTVTAEQ
jgi:basic amino acid/polyamine antiporter, APA family